MSLLEIYINSNITRVAIVDDDLSTSISIADIAMAVGENESNVLKDSQDPDCEELIALLDSLGLPHHTAELRAQSLSCGNVLNAAPARIKQAAQAVFERRRDMAYFFPLVMEWLSDAGVDETQISVYGHPSEIDLNSEKFDLVLVDFLLVDTSEIETLKLVKNLKDRHEDEANPLMFILMSSHAEALSAKYSEIRPEIGLPGSQIRILKKPEPDNLLDSIVWRHTLEQIAHERPLVRPLGNFIKKWNESLISATDAITRGLWGLDAHSLDILGETAKKDHIKLEEYFSDILSRRVLAEIEESAFPKKETFELENSLTAIKITGSVLPGSEINDSRLALRSLLSDTVSHREGWWKADIAYPAESKERLVWIKKNLQFGVILFDETKNNFFVNLTQPCDLAHLNDDEVSHQHLLLIPGVKGRSDGDKDSTKECTVTSVRFNDEWISIKWFLRRPYSPSVKDFLELNDQFEMVGRLRQDHTQSIVSKYSALASRIALPVLPRFTELVGSLCTVRSIDDRSEWVKVSSDNLNFHLVLNAGESKGKEVIEKFIQLDPKSCQTLIDNLGNDFNVSEVILCLLKGFSIGTTHTIEKLKIFFVDANGLDTFDKVKMSGVLLDQRKSFLPKCGAPEKLALIIWRE